MERNYPAAGLGDLGAETGWYYDRSAKASLVYGSSKSSHPGSELLHRQAYSNSHNLQGFVTNHHPGSSRQGGVWGAAGHTLGLSRLFEASLHHTSPSIPDPSVMNLISALESRASEPPPSASALLSQFRTPSWQNGMHTSAPPDLYISGALPVSSSFSSSSTLSAYQHPGSFSVRSLTPSLSLQDMSTLSPTSNGLLSPHDPLLHIKPPSQSSLGFDRCCPSRSLSVTYQGSQDSPALPQTQAPSNSSSCHLPPPQFNLLSSQLHSQSSQLYNGSMFSSTPALPPVPPPSPERMVSRQDSVIKHYQSSPPAQSTSFTIQQYVSCSGSSSYQQIASYHRHSGVSSSPLGEQSPSSDPKTSPQMESQIYQSIMQTPYTSMSSGSSASSSHTKGPKSSSSSSGYSSSGSASSCTPHTPPSASSTSSSSSSSTKTSTGSLSSSSHQQPPTQSAPVPSSLQVVSSNLVQQPTPKQCLATYSPLSVTNSSTGLPDQTPPQQHAQSYSPSQPPSAHMAQSYGDFNSPHSQDLSSRAEGNRGKAFIGIGPGGHSLAAEIHFGDSAFGSAPLRRVGSPSLGCGGAGGSAGPVSGPAALSSGVGSVGSGSGAASAGNRGSSSYHLPKSSPSPSLNSIITCPGLHSPAAARPALSPGGSGPTKYLSSILSPACMSSQQGFPDTGQAQSQLYHSTPPKPKTETNILGVKPPQNEEEDDDDFLIHHLLHTQSTTHYSSQHHPPPQQLPQSLPEVREEERKGVAYDISKFSEERYHLQSVIRINNTTSSAGPGTAIADTTNGLTTQFETSQKKQQQTKSELTRSKSTTGEAGVATDCLSLSHQQQQDSLDSVVHYGRGNPCIHHPQSEHSLHTSHVPRCTQYTQISQHTQHPQHSQHSFSHSHLHNHSHIEMKKTSDVNAYLVNTTDVQQARQNQVPLSLMDSPPDPSHQTHMLQSVLSHTTHSKMGPPQAHPQQQQHCLDQQLILGSAGGAARSESHSQNHSSQLRLQLQTQGIDTKYSLGAKPRDQTQVTQSSVSPLDFLDKSLSQRNRDSEGVLERTGVRVAVTGGEGGNADRQRQQHRLTSHHLLHQSASELHDFLSEPDLGLSTPSHLHHLNQSQAHAHPHTHQPQQAHVHHQLSHSHPHSQSPLQQPRTREPENRLSYSQLDLLKQYQLDTANPVAKAGQNQAQQHRFASLTSICFPDYLLNNEDHAFFPEMEMDMLCSVGYKSSCAGDSRGAEAAQESLAQGNGQGQDGLDSLKTGGAGGCYDMVGHHSGQGYGQYCHTIPGIGNGNLHLNLDSTKTHELPSTVNTDQLGLIQSQTPTICLNSAVDEKMIRVVGMGESSSTTGLNPPIFCSSRPKKLLKTSTFHLLKQRCEPQPQTKKNYAQEYEFMDDEDKADVPADIRLNNRRLPDLLPDLVSSCRKAGGASGISGLSPLMGDMEFCHPTSYTSVDHSPQFILQDGPKKRGRKPTKPKREGPPRPRGRPRIRPLPEPSYSRGLISSLPGESRRGRGRGRGRGRREEGHVEMHRDMNKAQSLPYHNQQHQQQEFSQQQHLQHQGHQVDQAPQQHYLHNQQQHDSCSQHQSHHHEQQHQHQLSQQQQDPIRPIKIKLPTSTMLPSESLFSTDSPSSTETVLSDGSVGSAPSLGLSPGPSTAMDISRNELNQMQDKTMNHQEKAAEADEKAFDFKPGFMASFLDFLKTGKKQSGIETEHSGGQHGPLNPCSSLNGGIRPLTPSPPTLPPTLPQHCTEGEQGVGTHLALSSCPSPCKPLDEELKRNLETLPSFSSDEEDSMSKNQDLQKSISSAISALYDTPQSLATAMASAMVKAPPTLSPVNPPLPAMLPLIPNTETGKEDVLTHTQHHTKDEEEQKLVSPHSNKSSPKKAEREFVQGEEEEEEEEGRATDNEQVMRDSQNVQQGTLEDEKISEMQICEVPKVEDSSLEPLLPPASSISPSPPTHSSPLPLPPLCLSVPSPLSIQQDDKEASLPYPPSKQQQPSYQPALTTGTLPSHPTSPPSSPLSNFLMGQSILHPSTTPPPSSSDEDQKPNAGQPSPSSPSSASPSSSFSLPPSPPTPEEGPASQRLTSLHLAMKQADAAIAGESEEEDSESGGEGIFRERDEFVVRAEDIGTLKMALQTGREPPPIWRVQKALLQKFSPEIKDGQRQFCATSNYLGYFGDAKMRYQRLYVKFLENVNKKDYVRVCSRKPWHRAGLTLRRQSLPKHLSSIHNQIPPLAERDKENQKQRELKEQREKEKEQRDKACREKVEKESNRRERREKEEREHKEKQEREQRERDRKEKMKLERDKKDREWKECRENEKELETEMRTNERWDTEQKEREKEKEQKDRERCEYEKKLKERERKTREQREKQKQDREQKERERQEREQKERKIWEMQWKERDKQEREKHRRDQKEKGEKERKQSERDEKDQKKKVKQERETKGREGEKREGECKDKERQEREWREMQREKNRENKEKEGREREKEKEKWKQDEGERRDATMEFAKLKGHFRAKTSKEKMEPPLKKRKKWLKEVPSSYSESDSSLPSDDEGPVWGGVNNRAMREMFRSYVEMLVSTALDPDMIQALEDTDDELYLPPMRKIDNLLSEQKKRLLRRVNISGQHQEALHIFPKMTADPLESGVVRVHLGGESYNRKTLNRVKKSIPTQQDLKLSIETCRIYSLYHSLHHYKYHTFLHCKKETDSIEQAAEDPGQEEVVQQCMANQDWLENLFNSFMDLLSLSANA